MDIKGLGTVVDKVKLDIDLHIIEHFSSHLYSSPTKAIEELVANGYDAAADTVKIYLPGSFTQKVIIWDDGFSMNIEGLKSLWKVATSPKLDGSNREVKTAAGIRKVIGKFGIGKIASYTLGNQIFHICKSSSKFLAVGMDYKVLLANTDAEDGQAHEESDIYELTEEAARKLLKSTFIKVPDDFDTFFSKPTWTFAVIDGLKNEVKLQEGRIRWVLGNGMPIQPQFAVSLNDEPIESNLKKKNLTSEWDFSQPEIIEQITRNWKEAVKDGDVKGELEFGKGNVDLQNPAIENPFVKFPNLGKVYGLSRLYSSSLLASRSNDHGRSFGFFIMVRGRLINQDDAQFFLPDPSFSTFYSAQWILHVDDIDSDLLADRERVKESSPKSAELRLLQKAVYRALVAKQQKDLKELADEDKVQKRFPLGSAEYFIEPLAALWMQSGSEGKLGFDYKDPPIEPKPLGVDQQISKFSPQDGFLINSQHPYYQYVSYLLGGSKNGRKVVKEFEVVAVCEKLFEGYMIEIGLGEDDIKKIMSWRDRMYRQIAAADKGNLAQICTKLEQSSYHGHDDFEYAIVDILNAMGFIAERDGASGKKDVYVKANCGDDSYKLIFEGKGKNDGCVNNGEAKVSAAENHRVEAGADHAVIVARKFCGFEKGNPTPAVFNECSTTNGTVSIMEVGALLEIAKSVQKNSYSLDSLKEIFTTLESPIDKMKRIEEIESPFENFSYIDFLRNIWDAQEQLGRGGAISILSLWQKHYFETHTFEDIQRKAQALRTFVFPLLQYDQQLKTIFLTNSPDIIISEIQSKFSE